MTREELFSAFPRPWRPSEGQPGVILDAEDKAAVTVDPDSELGDDAVAAMVELIADLVNGAEE